MPEPIKELLRFSYSLVPLRLRMGHKYWEIKSFLEEAQWWNKEAIERWQLRKLREIVRYAYENVPAYYFLYKEAGVRPDDIQDLSNIKLLPFVTKELIRDNLEDFTSRSIPRWKLRYITTGGSTGIPLGFYHTEINGFMENAFMHMGWERVGWKLGDSSAVLRGTFVGSKENFWKYDSCGRELLLSSYYLTEETYERYVEKILEYKPLHLQAYPSSATILSDLIISNDDVGRVNFQIVLLGSENIYDWQKERVSQAFPGARLFGWYGHSEQVVLASMCEYSDQYHIWPFYGFTEILDEDGNEVGEGEVGELVGTSFWNYATPFLRYRTMDTARKGKFGCDRCGRQFQLLVDIEGRVQDILITKTERYIPVPSTSIHSDIFDNVKQFQFYQDTPGRVVFKVVRKDGYTDEDTEKIYRGLKRKLGEDMELEIAFVDEIPKTPRGKYRFLDQRLELKYGE